MLVREAAVLGTSGHPGEALAACGPAPPLDRWRLTTSGCLELDAIRRPVPSTEAPCQHRDRTAVRSRRQRFWPVSASAKPVAEAWSAWDPPREGSRARSPRRSRVDPQTRLPVVVRRRTSRRFAPDAQRGHRAYARRDTAAAVAGPADPDAGSAAAARPGAARGAGPDPPARHLTPCRTGARLTAAPCATFRCSPPPRRDASRTRAQRRRGT